MPMKNQFLVVEATRDPTMAELQTYAAAKQTSNENGLKIVNFERKPDQPALPLTNQESETKRLQQMGAMKRIQATK